MVEDVAQWLSLKILCSISSAEKKILISHLSLPSFLFMLCQPVPKKIIKQVNIVTLKWYLTISIVKPTTYECYTHF